MSYQQHLFNPNVQPIRSKRLRGLLQASWGSAASISDVYQTPGTTAESLGKIDSCCVLCRESSIDHITNNIPASKRNPKTEMLENTRYLSCRNCGLKSCYSCIEAFYNFFSKKGFYAHKEPWMKVAKNFLDTDELLCCIDGSLSHCCQH